MKIHHLLWGAAVCCTAVLTGAAADITPHSVTLDGKALPSTQMEALFDGSLRDTPNLRTGAAATLEIALDTPARLDRVRIYSGYRANRNSVATAMSIASAKLEAWDGHEWHLLGELSAAVDNPELCWDIPVANQQEFSCLRLTIHDSTDTARRQDGQMLTPERRGAPTRGDRHGYIPEALRQFNRAARKAPDHRPAEADPEWKKFRAEWVGEYLREARRGLRNPPEIVGFVPWDAELHAYGDPLGWLTDGTLDAAAVYRHASGRWGVADTYRKEDRRRFPGETAKYAIIYLYGKDRDAELEAARSAAEAGFTGIIWMESANLSGSGRYAMTRRLAGPDTAELISPEYDLSRGGDLQVLATGEWRLVVGDFLASGSAGKLAKIVIPPQNRRAALRFTLSHPPEATAAGLVVEGEIGGTKVRTAPETWRASAPGYTLTTVSTGIPGIPPFLECNLEDDDK